MTDAIPFTPADGGRSTAGYRGNAGDCATRAIAIATDRPYREVYDLVNSYASNERTGRRKRGKSNARKGVYIRTMRKIMADLGWTWNSAMHIGSGCSMHLRADEVPEGRVIVRLSRHHAAVIDGVLYDTHDCSREGTRCVYGYWSPAEAG